ncbi:MAG TPA: hypothetical protein DCX60_05120 [Phycisphaerales bacterium]|nr:hypothetical protein [Phycisphaerales bacterium]
MPLQRDLRWESLPYIISQTVILVFLSAGVLFYCLFDPGRLSGSILQKFSSQMSPRIHAAHAVKESVH